LATSIREALFAPKAVALIGASGDASKNTARPQRYLRKHGYAGKIFPINPTRKEIFGEKAYARVSDVPEPVEHAYILIEDVEQAIEDCGQRGVAVASIFSGGFADAGERGLERQQRLAARAKALGVRLLGPNSMGVIDIRDRIKDVIKTGGEWISSLDLEDLISRHPAVREVAVVGIADPQWGEHKIRIPEPSSDD